MVLRRFLHGEHVNGPVAAAGAQKTGVVAEADGVDRGPVGSASKFGNFLTLGGFKDSDERALFRCRSQTGALDVEGEAIDPKGRRK